MDNTFENQAKFSSQYFGKTFYTGIGGKSALSWIDIGYISLGTLSASLELKSLSNITKEDLQHLQSEKYKFFKCQDIELKDVFTQKEKIFLEVKLIYAKGWKQFSFELSLYHADYLKLKGYALPYMGLSIEKQIEYRWIKLKK